MPWGGLRQCLYNPERLGETHHLTRLHQIKHCTSWEDTKDSQHQTPRGSENQRLDLSPAGIIPPYYTSAPQGWLKLRSLNGEYPKNVPPPSSASSLFWCIPSFKIPQSGSLHSELHERPSPSRPLLRSKAGILGPSISCELKSFVWGADINGSAPRLSCSRWIEQSVFWSQQPPHFSSLFI